MSVATTQKPTYTVIDRHQRYQSHCEKGEPNIVHFIKGAGSDGDYYLCVHESFDGFGPSTTKHKDQILEEYGIKL